MSLRLTTIALAAIALSAAACNRQETPSPEKAADAALDASTAATEAQNAADAAANAADVAADKAEEAGAVVPGTSAPTTDANPTPSQMVPADDSKG